MPSKRALKGKVRKLLAARDRGKAAYAEADGRLEDLLKLVKPGQSIELGDGRTAEVVDNFASVNKVWKPAAVSRFDIKITQA